jgi:hypothetical protein
MDLSDASAQRTLSAVLEVGRMTRDLPLTAVLHALRSALESRSWDHETSESLATTEALVRTLRAFQLEFEGALRKQAADVAWTGNHPDAPALRPLVCPACGARLADGRAMFTHHCTPEKGTPND